MRQILVTLVSVVLATGSTGAQAPAPAANEPRFEVVSVRANHSGEPVARVQYGQGGRLTAINATLRRLMVFAYQLQNFQIEGGPDWIGSARFDVQARATTDASVDQVREMTRTLLAEHFGLVVRRNQRDQPVYALTLSRADGRLGAGLRTTTLDCSVEQEPRPGGCRYFGPTPDLPITAGRLSFRAFSMDAFAAVLVGMVGRMVVNRTGLAGSYDGDFDATSEIPLPPPPPGAPEPFNRQEMPSVFTVLPDQLGLKLESTRSPVEILTVVDVRRPEEQ